MMFYCDVNCQFKDWMAFHQFSECDLYVSSAKLGRQRDLLNCADARLAIRTFIAAKLKMMGHTPFGTFYGGVRSFADLADHFDKISANFATDWRGDLRFVIKLLNDIGLIDDCLLQLCAKIFVNAFTISDFKLSPIGRGLYIEASVFDHSCRPNAVAVFDGHRLQIRAIRTINIDNEKITVSYINPIQDKASRKFILKQLYYFDCKCIACQPDYDESKLTEFKCLHSKMVNNLMSPNKMIRSSMALINFYQQLLGFHHPEITLQLYAVALLINGELVNPVESKDMMDMFREAIRVTHGEDHTFYDHCVQIGLIEPKPVTTDSTVALYVPGVDDVD